MSACAPAQLGKRDEGGGAGHPATNPCPAPNATQELLLREGLWAGGLAKSLGFSLIALRRVFFVSVALPPVLNIPRICCVHRMRRSSSNLSGRGASVLAFPFNSGVWSVPRGIVRRVAWRRGSLKPGVAAHFKFGAAGTVLERLLRTTAATLCSQKPPHSASVDSGAGSQSACPAVLASTPGTALQVWPRKMPASVLALSRGGSGRGIALKRVEPG